MKGELKARTVDKYLLPIRKQVEELIAPDSRVVDFGCGNGTLLFLLAEKIKSGLGIDHSRSLIDYANNRKAKEGFQNVDFQLVDLNTDLINEKACYACASLLFHVLPQKNALDLLHQMIDMSSTTIICAFCKPENWRQQFLLWMDQRFTGHYQHFKQYQKNGSMMGILEKMGNINYQCYDTFDPVIKIYKVTK